MFFPIKKISFVIIYMKSNFLSGWTENTFDLEKIIAFDEREWKTVWNDSKKNNRYAPTSKSTFRYNSLSQQQQQQRQQKFA